MKHQIFRLRELYPSLPGSYDVTLTAYCPENSPEIDPARRRPAILICPGGGYAMTSDREAEPVALRFLAMGYSAFVLRYGVDSAKYPEALLEGASAMNLIRTRAEEFLIDPAKIAVCGFSAGGHLAASIGVLWNDPVVADALKIPARSARPDAMILCYPVISSGEFAHRGSFEYLLGTPADAKLLNKLSLENSVHPEVPPAFLWHTFEDDCVPVENSLLFAAALRKNDVPFEMHIFPEGGHGMSLCDYESDGNNTNTNPHCANWVALCDEWLRLTFK